MNSCRVNDGLLTYTHRTFLQRSDWSAACNRVVFPVPASPMSTVNAFAENNPYSSVLSASRCFGVMNRNRWFAVSSNGRSRKTVEILIHRRICLRLQAPHHDEHDRADQHRRARRR